MVEHMLRTVLDLLIQGYCATVDYATRDCATRDCATRDCARLCGKRYYCTLGKEKNTTNYACNTYSLRF